LPKAGQRLIESAGQALAFAQGQAIKADHRVHIPEEIDVKKIRQKFHMNQARFAKHFGFCICTLQEWEQGRSVPRGVAKHFLIVLNKEPEAVRRALIAPESPRVLNRHARHGTPPLAAIHPKIAPHENGTGRLAEGPTSVRALESACIDSAWSNGADEDSHRLVLTTPD
jgi:putative transcriptional regulator